MIVYGSGGGTSNLGEAGTHECPACNQTSTFSAICNYTYWHIYWLCSIVTKREFYIMCDNCQSCNPIDKAMVKEQFPRDNIPFIRKRGWMLFAVLGLILFGGIAVGSIASSQAKQEKITQFLQEPKVGTILHLNLSYVDGSGFGPDNPEIKNRQAWGVMKLLEIDEGVYSFATSTKAWEEKKGLRQALGRGQVRYDMEALVHLDTDDLNQLNKDGRIIEVDK